MEIFIFLPNRHKTKSLIKLHISSGIWVFLSEEDRGKQKNARNQHHPQQIYALKRLIFESYGSRRISWEDTFVIFSTLLLLSWTMLSLEEFKVLFDLKKKFSSGIFIKNFLKLLSKSKRRSQKRVIFF